jgi:tubulin-folding cofactor B
MKIYEVKDYLSKKFGTLPELMRMLLRKQDGQTFEINNDSKALGEYNPEEFDTLHVLDLNPNSVLVQHNFDDMSTVQKYEISEEDYDKRDDSVRKFKKKLFQDPNYQKFIKENQSDTYEEEAKAMEVGNRCLLGDGFRRGEIKYVGKIPELGIGYWIGVKLDEPSGDCNGK